MPRPSIGGDAPDFRRDGSHTGSRLSSSARQAGRVLKTGLGTFSRMTITPSIRLSVSPTRSRRPLETLNRPITPRMGIDSPIRARIVRSGRVSRLRQAKTPMFDAPRAWSGDDDRSVGHCSLPLPATAGKYRPDHHYSKMEPKDAAGSMKGGSGGITPRWRACGSQIRRWSLAAPCPRAVRSCDHATYCVSFAPELGSADGAVSGWACSGGKNFGRNATSAALLRRPFELGSSAAGAAAANSSGVASTCASQSCLSWPKVPQRDVAGQGVLGEGRRRRARGARPRGAAGPRPCPAAAVQVGSPPGRHERSPRGPPRPDPAGPGNRPRPDPGGLAAAGPGPGPCRHLLPGTAWPCEPVLHRGPHRGRRAGASASAAIGRGTDRRRRQRRAGGTRRPCSIRRPCPDPGPVRPVLPAVPAPWPRRPPPCGTTLPLGPRLDHRQRDPFPLLVDAHHPDRHHVAHAHHVVRALDVAVGELADVDQPRVLQADVDEGAEVDDVQDRPLQLHAGGEVFELQDALLEDRLGQVVARVALGPGQGLDDVARG